MFNNHPDLIGVLQGVLIGVILTIITMVLLSYLYKIEFVFKPVRGPVGLAGPAALDPWEIQRTMIEVSAQVVPNTPQVNKTSILYFALMLEEMAETGKVLHECLTSSGACNSNFPQALVRRLILDISDEMGEEAKRLRTHLVKVNNFTYIPTEAEAAELLDGVTDNAVVNCGFTVACGLPGAEGYVEVAKSNLSKRNPESGVIDKTPDRKWIKGVNYHKPDLATVLECQLSSFLNKYVG